MNPVSDLGAIGYLLFWGLTALATGIFLYRGAQLLRYIFRVRDCQGNLPAVTCNRDAEPICFYLLAVEGNKAEAQPIFQTF